MSDENTTQENMDLGTTTGGIDSVEKYQFAPIKGYPMLSWRGKRPFTSTQFYPAQLKEVHGEEVDGWRNKIFWGDNLQVMSHLLKEFRGKVDLIYIDPPFDSKADYKKSISVKGKSADGAASAFEEKQYTDIWTNDEYLQFMFERILILRELLAPHGSIYLHCDYRKSHYLKLIMDEVFGAEAFINEIVWLRTNAHNMKSKGYARSNDHILFYRNSKDFTFNEQYMPYGEAQLSRYKEDADGRLFTGRDLTFSGSNPEKQFDFRGTTPPPNRSWGLPLVELEKLWEKGLILVKKDGTPRLDGYKVFLDDAKGTPLTCNWNDISRIGNTSGERLDYPTQKPEELLERIIKVSSNPGDLVLDCFMGSGTTLAAAQNLGRKFIGADVNLGAVQTATKRLSKVGVEASQKSFDENDEPKSGFELYNVNHYDIFRNPVQAKELLLEALEVQKLEMSTVFDGEKDGRMVKIMPVNRIATRADLNELTSGFDYKAWERRKAENPNRPVEKITLVCMGHEPDLKGTLEFEAKPYKIDVEVVDILRDKADLEFKRDSDAKVVVSDGELVVERFYPMNLLQKLSMQKEAVDDWRELTESILIDWNYDGAVLQPAVVDIPEKKTDLVIGRYKVPADAGTIRVKITDLLSESWEGSVTNG
ncbi:site-specific DNA-methyltransferase [Marivita sp.]|uniref:site-specific DNA-methyltransferase n=1 Tax=Marivita sp. TaxID=2003365 RepID=UPI002627D302|nr:site-specific DNA-methyltransferase [Marivita sp.]